MLFVDTLALIEKEINNCLLEILMQGSVSFVVRERLKTQTSRKRVMGQSHVAGLRAVS